MAAFHKNTSMYKQTPVREFYLDKWVPVDIDMSDSTEYIIDSKYHQRPDLLAFEQFGTPNLWWVFAVVNRNYLNDPIEDFQAGLEIQVPSQSSISKLL